MAINSLLFAEATQQLPSTLESEQAEMVDSLAQRGYEVRQGLTPYYAGAIGMMALQPHIHGAYPMDASGSRFASEGSTAEWQSRDGGKHMFLLLKRWDNSFQRLVGYGWTGPETPEELPDSETTFALRLGEEGIGKHLELPFAELIIAGSRRIFEAKNFWLETWASDKSAVTTYEEAGFEIAHEVKAVRGSLRQKKNMDTRLYMTLS